MAERPAVLVVGSATRDLDPTDDRGWRLGGSVSYAAIIAAALGVHVHALVGVDATADTAAELDIMRAAGVDLRLHRLTRGPVFENQQTPSGRVQHAVATSDALPIDALPDNWRDPDAAILGPVAGELRDDWADAFGPGTFVGLAAQGLTRRLTPGAPVARVPLTRSALVARADAIVLSSEDVADANVALDGVLRTGQQLLVTHGDRGALAVQVAGGRTQARHVPALPRRQAIDTTGAGDTFLAAYVVGRVLSGRHAAALVLASAVASLSVQGTALAHLPTQRDICEGLVTLRDGRRPPA